MSTASTNASICILLARFTKAQFTDDSAYDSLSCPLQESRQNFHSSVLVISISALARTMASSSLGTTPGKNNSTCTLPFSWDKGPSKFLPRHGFAFFPPVGQIKKKKNDWPQKKTEAHVATENRQKHRLSLFLLRDFSFLLYIQLLPYSLAMATPI